MCPSTRTPPRLLMAAPGRLRRCGRNAITALLAVVLIVFGFSATPAHAEPTLAELEQQIKELWEQSEPLIEEYNAIHEDYRAKLAQQKALEEKIKPLETELALARARVGAIAAEAYMGGGFSEFNGLLSTGSPQLLADRLLALEQLAAVQDSRISTVQKLKAEYDRQKAPIDALVAELQEKDADLAARKKTIESQLAELQRLRSKAYGSTGQTGSYRPWPCPTVYEPTPGYTAANFACKQAGKPYVWASSGPNSYDCSGLTLRSWAQVGVSLPHQSREQYNVTKRVTRADLQLGDLVFYYSPIHHVAIYVGSYNGTPMVMHAPAAGDRVRMVPLDDAGPVVGYGRP